MWNIFCIAVILGESVYFFGHTRPIVYFAKVKTKRLLFVLKLVVFNITPCLLLDCRF